MNLIYSIDKSLRIVFLNYTGDPDFNEWADTMRAVFHDPSFEPGFSFIIDRRLVKTAPTTDYIKKIVAFAKNHPDELGKCRTAVVVSEITAYGMARMSQAYLGDASDTQIFKDIEEAKRWLRPKGPRSNA